ncbi:hypothetical protein OM076_13965 [Solirubrobacter ginsenosidimutans]|uniref:Uncharacterized protein n=1 Tax=Solirubrobacter ginsenosidimutans TaxID=490573 RepID=A0A9X3MRT0_9ACTN|nr:hypothetical protein [Solirubrobacter ginsenosidimutans]MDA0161379.1 hypothetical protein [Solirubrobacter ginsenosidimutans]
MLALLGCEDEPDRFVAQPACDERQDLSRGAVEPMRVVDQADQRCMLGGLAEEAQHGEADQKAIRCFAGVEAERRGQRVALRRRQTLESIQQRGAQLLEAGERQPHL